MEKQKLLSFISQFNRIHNQFTAVKRTLFCESGGEKLFPSEMHVLVLLAGHRGYTVTDIASSLYITKSAASQIVKKLTTRKYLTKSRSEENERIVNLEVTQKGRQAVEDFISLESRVFGEFLKEMMQLTQEEQGGIEFFLNKLEAMFDKKLG